jgi:hypothetical protein
MLRSKNLIRTLAWLTGIVLVSYFAYSTYKNQSLRAELDTARERVRADQINSLTSSLRAMIKRHEANDKWVKVLMGSETFRMSPVLTAELQEQWIGSNPILFIGTVGDVSKSADGNYRVQVARSIMSGDEFFLSNDISIEVSCAPDRMQPYLKAATDPSRNAGFADTAIIAHIAEITSKVDKDVDGKSATTLIGVGECSELLFLPYSLPINWQSVTSNN